MKKFHGNDEILKPKQGYLGTCTFMHSFLAMQIWIKPTNLKTFYYYMPYYGIKSQFWCVRG